MEGRWTMVLGGGGELLAAHEGIADQDYEGLDPVPAVPCDDAAIERAARGLCEFGVLTVDGEVATWERHRRKLTRMAIVALACAGHNESRMGDW